MKAISKLPVRFSANRLQNDLAVAGTGKWRSILDDRPDGHWTGVALRSHDGQATTMEYAGEDYRDTPLLTALPYARDVLQFFQCDLMRVRFLALHSGAVIPEHRDVAPGYARPQVRLHLPITTNEQVVFRVGGQDLRMRPGELWFVDVTRPHAVANHGGNTRVHLVIDCVLNNWLRKLIEAGSFDPEGIAKEDRSTE